MSVWFGWLALVVIGAVGLYGVYCRGKATDRRFQIYREDDDE